MKFSIEEHQRFLTYMEDNFTHTKEELRNQILRVRRQEQEIKFFKMQINMAILTNKDGFDAERFMKKERQEYMK